MATYRKWLGFSAVQYQSGAYFKRADLQNNEHSQIDLLFSRKDRVHTVCEIKYTESPVGTSAVAEVERKISLLSLGKKDSISRVLISACGTDKALAQRHYFDAILTLDDFFQKQIFHD